MTNNNKRQLAVRVGHSALFKTLDGLTDRLAQASAPLELVFPIRNEEETPLLGRVDRIAECVNECGSEMLSIHAPPLEMDGSEFIDDALALARLADDVGASSVTLHPSKCMNLNGRPERQLVALQNLEKAQTRTNITLALETLGHTKCLFTCSEIIGLELPMVLDTTHIGWAQSYDVIANYADRVVTLHLSERTEDSQHQPIAEASLKFVEHLCRIGWSGNIILEYWPWRCGYYNTDIEKVEKQIYLTKEGALLGENTYRP